MTETRERLHYCGRCGVELVQVGAGVQGCGRCGMLAFRCEQCGAYVDGDLYDGHMLTH
jgi:ribosomal protein S27AE